MTPARNLLQRHYDNCGVYRFSDTQLGLIHQEKALMAAMEEQAGTSTSKEEEEEEYHESSYNGSWLKLGINNFNKLSDVPRTMEEKVELNLYSGRPPDVNNSQPTLPVSATTMIAKAPVRCTSSHGQINPVLAYWREASRIHPNQNSTVPGGDNTIRAVRSPPRPQVGVWFELRAAQNQVKEAFLPQIHKSYLRIKDGRMTVSLLMKYLANKLGLNDESEVEITCRDQQLPPFLSLLHVRDQIWCSREAITSLPDSLSTEHRASLSHPSSIDTGCVMILRYSRKAWYMAPAFT